METHSYTVALLVYTAKESYLWLYRMCLPCFSLLKKKGLHNYTMKKLTVSKHFSQKECLMNNHKTPLMLKSREKEDRISLGKKNTRYIHQTPPTHTLHHPSLPNSISFIHSSDLSQDMLELSSLLCRNFHVIQTAKKLD